MKKKVVKKKKAKKAGKTRGKKVGKKKTAVKNTVKKPAKTRRDLGAKAKTNKPVGVVTHFYGNIKVAIVKFKVPFKVGTAVKIKGATTDFSEKIVSMQFDHKPIRVAKKNQQVGIKLKKKVREGDTVCLDK